jgi:hypothetical protein
MADTVIPKEMWFKKHRDKYRETTLLKQLQFQSKITTQLCPIVDMISLDNTLS